MTRTKATKAAIDSQSPIPPLKTEPRAELENGSTEQAEERRVSNAIFEAVLSHQLPPGTRLVETPLCRAFGVSRSLLRRVLVRLANEKVIELNHNRGATVAHPSPIETERVFEARRLIEVGLLRELPATIPAKKIEAVRELVTRENECFLAGQWSSGIRLSGEFHLQIAELLGNPEIVEILRSLVARTTLMIALYDSPARGVCSCDEHNEILDALSSGNREKACRSMADHLRVCEDKLTNHESREQVDIEKLFGG